MELNTCKVSVITTVYNVGDYLKTCIDSILNQTLQDIELILVNDCSTDNSLDIINTYNDSRIKLINNDENVGCGMSRQIGLDNAVGEYTMFVDGDDYIESDCLEMMYNAIQERGVKMVSCEVNSQNHRHINYLTEFLNNKLIDRTVWSEISYSTMRCKCDTCTAYRLFEVIGHDYHILDYNGYNYSYREDSLNNKISIHANIIYNVLDTIENVEWRKQRESLSLQFKEKYNKIKLLLRHGELQHFLNQLKRYNRLHEVTDIYSNELQIIENNKQKILGKL